MNGIILYKSKYGATQKYAQWLSEATGFPTMEADKATPQDMAPYDTVILGGGIHASGVQGLSFLTKHAEALRGKRVLVFCVGASPYDEDAFAAVRQRNMKGALAGVPLFYCRGMWDLQGMTFVDRTMCQLLRKSLAKRPPEKREPWMNALLEAGDAPTDWTDRAYLDPLLAYLNQP